MAFDNTRWVTLGRRLWLGLTAVLGVTALVGSGGVAFFPELNLGGLGVPTPMVTVEPAQPVVQVGDTITFTANPLFATQPIAYQWQRNGVAIAGATAASHTLVGANLGDDEARFEVTVTAANGSARGAALLRVSSAPGVVFQDRDFALADWAVDARVVPPSNGPLYTAAAAATGGHPDAFRSIVYQMTPGPSSARLLHVAANATFDPATQGAVYAIDMGLDCNRVNTTTLSETLLLPVFEQAGRRYAPQIWDAGCAPLWQGRQRTGLLASDFTVSAGPPCAAGERCPDFSVSAAPLRFGFESSVNVPSGTAAGAVTQGIDNWKVTVWRR